jgi:hypothetical protein
LSNFLKHWTLSAAKHTSTRHNTAAARRPLLQLPNDLTCAPTVFVRRDRQVPLLQLLYDDTYAVIRRSLHHFTLRIGGKEDKVFTLDSSPAPTLQRRLRSPGSGAAHPPPSNSVISNRQGLRRPAGDTSPHSNQQNRARNRFPPGPPPGVFARLASILDHAATRPACNRQVPSRLDLWASVLEAWGEPCGDS